MMLEDMAPFMWTVSCALLNIWSVNYLGLYTTSQIIIQMFCSLLSLLAQKWLDHEFFRHILNDSFIIMNRLNKCTGSVDQKWLIATHPYLPLFTDSDEVASNGKYWELLHDMSFYNSHLYHLWLDNVLVISDLCIRLWYLWYFYINIWQSWE